MNNLFFFLLTCAVTCVQYNLLKMDVTVTNGMSKTEFFLSMYNPSNVPKEANITVYVPELASVSGMELVNNGKRFKGVVLEDLIAKKIFENAKKDGRTAGLVSVRATSLYALSVTLGANANAEFTLTYEELLTKRYGQYESFIYVRPGFVAQNLSMTVNILDKLGISSFTAPSFAYSTSAEQIWTPGSPRAYLRYYASPADQLRQGTSGLQQNLVIKYAIPNLLPEGTIYFQKDFFVHLFSPSGLTRMGKNIVFVLDNSGSMGTTKMEQAKVALANVVGRLSDNDYFNIVVFSSNVATWQPQNMLVQATADNKELARAYINNVKSDSATNINDAMLTALRILKSRELPNYRGMVVLLTDGQPTVGVVDKSAIRSNIRNENSNGYSIFCLGFGFDLDYTLLRAIAYENGGSDRRIYEDLDAAQQIANFYDEIGAPVLTNIQLSYSMITPSSITPSLLTRSNYKMLFEGSQFLVAGKLDNFGSQQGSMQVTVNANSATGAVQYAKLFAIQDTSSSEHIPTERIWAFQTLIETFKDMYIEQAVSTQSSSKTPSYEKALALALKYQLVTPITAMIVEQVNNTNNDPLSPSNNPSRPFLGASSTLSVPPLCLLLLVLLAVLY